MFFLLHTQPSMCLLDIFFNISHPVKDTIQNSELREPLPGCGNCTLTHSQVDTPLLERSTY